MKWCDVCGNMKFDCDHHPSRSEWSWEPVVTDTNSGIRANGSSANENGDGNRLGDCLRERGVTIGAGFGDVRTSGGKSGRGCNKGKGIAPGKPSTRSWKSPVKNFPKKMIPRGFAKKFGKGKRGSVGRPRKAGVRCFLCKQFGHIASICPSKYINLISLPVESDYLVEGTCGGRFDSIWVVDPNSKTHMTGNKSVFKRFKKHFGVLTNDDKKELMFVHGIGEVKIPVGGKDKTIPCVSHVPKLNTNVLSLEQLLFQGIGTITIGDKCLLKKMFGDQAKGFDVFENKSEAELENIYLDKFYDGLGIDNGHREDKEKLREYVEEAFEKEFEIERKKNKDKKSGEGTSGIEKNEIVYSKKQKVGFMIYYEGLKDNPSQSRKELRQKAVVLSQDEEDVIENDMIIESCLETVDLISMHEELAGHDHFYRSSFEEIISFFIPCFLGIFKEKTMPPKLIDGRKLGLVLLHRIVKIKGGFKKVVQDDLWDEVAFEYGYHPDDAHVMKIAYVYYLELVEWYFDLMKKKNDKNPVIVEDDSKKDVQAEEIKEKSNGWIEDSSDDELVIIVEVTNNDNNK